MSYSTTPNDVLNTTINLIILRNKMDIDGITLQNAYGGFYEIGKRFTCAVWTSIANDYEKELQAHGSCTVRQLAARSRVSVNSARKAMDYYEIGVIVPPCGIQGHGLSGVGSISGMRGEHHAFIYQLYSDNPSLPLEGYAEELERKFGLVVHQTTIQRWFMTIGPFKGTMRVTSVFPDGRNSWQTYRMLRFF